MKKYIFLTLIIPFIFSCEEDDICEGSATPRMKILFQENATSINTTLDTLFVHRLELDGSWQQVFGARQVDSVQLALRLDDVNETKFVFTYSLMENATHDTLTVDYNYNEEFASKACGFKLNYTDVTYQSTTHEIISIEPQENEIKNETPTHLIINY